MTRQDAIGPKAARDDRCRRAAASAGREPARVASAAALFRTLSRPLLRPLLAALVGMLVAASGATAAGAAEVHAVAAAWDAAAKDHDAGGASGRDGATVKERDTGANAKTRDAGAVAKDRDAGAIAKGRDAGAIANDRDAGAIAKDRDAVMPAQCRVPDDTAMIDGPLPRLTRRLKAGEPLTIVVIGSGSAAGSGTSRKDAAFPYRLDVRFQKAFAKARTRLVVLAEMGQTAPSMYARIAKDVVPLNPALVIWQTGSADAARGIPVMEFGMSLERGIAELRDHGSDVLLVDSQFSPRASLLVNTDQYREAVRWNARRYDLPLFKRYDTMQYWWSNEMIDLDAEDKSEQLANADRIHDCVAALLVRLIGRGVAGAAKT